MAERNKPIDVKLSEALNMVDYATIGGGLALAALGFAVGGPLFLTGAAGAAAGKAYQYGRS